MQTPKGYEDATLPLVRIAIIVIRDSRQRYFVHRRRADKKVFPGLYGLGAGGRVEPQEGVPEGARRELLEETGLSTPVHAATSFEYVSHGFPYEVHLFETQSNGPIPNDDSEWQWSGWMTEHQVQDLMAEGKLCGDTAEGFRRLMDKRSTRR